MNSNRTKLIERKVHLLTDPTAPERKACSHLDQIHLITPNSDGCEQCLQMGDIWGNLRLCMTCRQVGCCDDSKNKHASKHHATSGHPIIMSFQPNEEWMWCYFDDVLFN